MNDRIQELAKQATIRVNHPTVNTDGKVICDNWEEGISISKFAELIVGHAIECVRDVLRDPASTLSYDDATRVQDCIRECFGMKR